MNPVERYRGCLLGLAVGDAGTTSSPRIYAGVHRLDVEVNVRGLAPHRSTG